MADEYSEVAAVSPEGALTPLVRSKLRSEFLAGATTKALVGDYAGQPLQFQAGITNVLTNASGDTFFTFVPGPFPNGVLSVVMTPYNISTGAIFVKINQNGTNKKDISFRVYGSNGAQLPNFSCWFTWMAMGW